MVNGKNDLGWRHLEYKFIETRSKQDLPEPGKWDVAFLMDDDVDREVEVLERLGVPQSNMVGIRGEDAKTFFGSTQDKFDIISLNYPAMTSDAEDAMRYIAGRQLLKEKSILVTKFSEDSSRSGIKLSNIDIKPLKLSEGQVKMLDVKLPRGINKKNFKALLERHINPGELGYDNIRELTAAMLLRGRGLLEMNTVFRRNPDIIKLEANMRRFFAVDDNVYAPPTPYFWDQMHHSAVGEKMHQYHLISYLEGKGYPARMTLVPIMYHNRPYFIVSSNSYSLREDGKLTASADFFLLDQLREMLDEYEELNGKLYAGLEEADLPPARLKEVMRDCSTLERFVNKANAINKKVRLTVDLSSGQEMPAKKNYMEQEKPKDPEKNYKNTFSLLDLFGSNQCEGYLKRLPTGTEERLKYFLSEDLPSLALNPQEKEQLVKNIADSRWCKIAEAEGSTSDMQIYALFDDIKLYCTYNGHPPGKEQIRKFFYHTLSGAKTLPTGVGPSF